MAEPRIMVVFGTRPEAIKMAPVVAALRASELSVCVVVTAQQREMLDQALAPFDLVPDEDLDLMQENQTLPTLFSRVLLGMTETFARRPADMLLVHGDTTTATASALAAFYAKVPVGHVEAGLRTGDPTRPWPEEANRKLLATLSTLHFAPTTFARDNLIKEGICEGHIHVTGNTVVDAMKSINDRMQADPVWSHWIDSTLPDIDPSKHLLLVTGHRRESFGAGLESICAALITLAGRDDLQIIYPVHYNPNVSGTVQRLLGTSTNIRLIPPLAYAPFVRLMSRAHILITDSGGIQEEAPALGKPVLVTRECTERPEGIASGTARLVGTDKASIIDAVSALLDQPGAYEAMSRIHNPYGDGKAAERIARILRSHMA